MKMTPLSLMAREVSQEGGNFSSVRSYPVSCSLHFVSEGTLLLWTSVSPTVILK